MTRSSPRPSSRWAAAMPSASMSASASGNHSGDAGRDQRAAGSRGFCRPPRRRLKAGDPLVFGRAGEEMAALRAAGIPFEVVPGVTAALAAAAEAEIPLTLRGTASSLVFATGQDASWRCAARLGRTGALRRNRRRLHGPLGCRRASRSRLMQAGLGAETPVAVIENATLPERRLFCRRSRRACRDRRAQRHRRSHPHPYRAGGCGRRPLPRRTACRRPAPPRTGRVNGAPQ